MLQRFLMAVFVGTALATPVAVASEAARVVYQLPADPGMYRVTLAVTKAEDPNWIVRTLVSGAMREVTPANKGAFSQEWDGLDEDGYPVQPGSFSWKGVYMPASKWPIDGKYHTFTARLAVAAGLTFHPAPSQDAQPMVFEGVSTSPINDVYVQPSGLVVFAGEYIENGTNPLIINPDEVGSRQCIAGMASGGVGGVTAAAGDGDFIYTAVAGSGPTDFILRSDANTGAKLGFGPGKSTYLSSVWEIPRPAGRPEIRPQDYLMDADTIIKLGGQPRESSAVSLAAQRTSAGKHLLYVPLLNVDKLVVLDGETAKVLAEVPGVISPRGTRLNPSRPESAVFVLCRGVGKPVGKPGGYVVARIPLKEGLPDGPAEVVAELDGLDATSIEKMGEKLDPVWCSPQGPWAMFSLPILVWRSQLQAACGLAVDQEGNFYVANQIASQVWKYSPQGRKLGEIGTPGGQQPGKFINEAMTLPTGLDIRYDQGGQGHVIVAEHSSSHRVSQWSTKGGFERDWIISILGWPAAVDSEKPEEVYASGSGGEGTFRFKVDYKTGDWKLDAIWPRQPGNPDIDPLWSTDMTCRLGMIQLNGRKFITSTGFPTSRFIYEVDGYRLIPRAAMGSYLFKDLAIRLGLDLDGKYPVVRNRMSTASPPELYRPCLWTWRDSNGDGKAQKEEFDFSPPPAFDFLNPGEQIGSFMYSYWGECFDSELNLLLPVMTPHAKFAILPRAGWDAHGNPIFRWSDLRVLAADDVLAKEKQANITALNLTTAAQGALFATEDYGPPSPGAIDHGADQSFTKLVRFDSDGKGGYKLAWRVGQHARGLIQPGEMYMPLQLSEPINDIVAVHDINGVTQLFTTDGLYLDTLLVDTYSHAPPRTAYDLSGEMFTGSTFYNRKDGEAYLARGHKATTLFRIEGLTKPDMINRIKGDEKPLALTASQIGPAKPWALGRKNDARSLALFTAAVGSEPALDGSMKGWEAAQAVHFELGADNYRVDVWPMYDQKNLYLRYHVVTGASPRAVDRGNLDRCFTHGTRADVLGFYVQGDGSADPKRGEGVLGDVRFVIAPTIGGAGKVEASVVGMYSVYPGKKHPLTYSSPVGKAKFDEVRVLDDARTGYTPDADGKGFVIAAAIPIADVPKLAIAGNLVTGVNFDAIFSSGARVWWSNPGGQPGAVLMSDEPSEARIYPQIWGLGQFQAVESLPLSNWQVIGPFGGDEISKLLATKTSIQQIVDYVAGRTYPPDKKVALSASYSDELTTDRSGHKNTLSWKSWVSQDNRVRLDKALNLSGKDVQSAAYAVTWVWAPKDISLTATLIHSRTPASKPVVWINANEVKHEEISSDVDPARKFVLFETSKDRGIALSRLNEIKIRSNAVADDWLFENHGGWSVGLELKAPEADLWRFRTSGTP